MELKEPRRKKCAKLVPKSSLPLVFGSKGELTRFHANLTALGSCIADPTEMQIIHKMGYFGKGSLSKSIPSFGRIIQHAPPIIRERQWQRRQNWIDEVQKLSVENLFGNDKHDNGLNKTDEKADEEQEVITGLNEEYTSDIKRAFEENTEKKDANDIEESKNDNCLHKDTNDDKESLNDYCLSENSNIKESSSTKEKSMNDIEILDCDVNNVNTNGQNKRTDVDMEVDEVVLDSTEEEDASEVSENYHFDEKIDLFKENDSLEISNDFFKKDTEDSDLQGKVLVLPDSDSETEDYLMNIKPEVRHENFPVRETLHLTFEETFFLMYGLGCLRLVDFDGKYLSIGETWDYFCKEQKYFLQKYITYHYFRSKGWVVKPGLKYGGDFLLYKEGPPFYHSSYLVIIDVLDAVTFKRIESKSMRNMSWNNFLGLERLAETVRKEVLFAQVLWPSSIPTDTIPSSPDILSQFSVKEVLWRRWKLNLNTFSPGSEDEYSEEDEDSS